MRPTDDTSSRLGAMHRAQIQRAPMPDFDSFRRATYSVKMRERAARQWWLRAREEYGSIHEFSLLLATLTRIRIPVPFTGALARLITDEARHADLCRQMAETISDTPFDWSPPAPPFSYPAPTQEEAALAWCADVIACSCCIGETVSRPLYEGLIAVTTDPVPRRVVQQILKDEHLHAAFGWQALEWLWPRLSAPHQQWLRERIAEHLAGFERSCSAGLDLRDLVGRELVIPPAGPGAPPNLGLQTAEHYAMIFYATIEGEVLPGFTEIGIDGMQAWSTRHQASPANKPPQ